MSGDRIDVRPAIEDELPAVMGVLDAAMLEVDAEAVRERIAGGPEVGEGDGWRVLVAVADDRVLGACVVDPGGTVESEGRAESGGRGRRGSTHVEAIAVRPGRRGQGIGTALIEAVADRRGSLTAEFDPRARPFYESLGFEVEPVADERPENERLRGHRE